MSTRIQEGIKSEIQWCKDNEGSSGQGKEFERGFLAGLSQSLWLIEKIQCWRGNLPGDQNESIG